MSTSKPICVVKIDTNLDFGNGEKVGRWEVQKELEEKMPDYYIFVLPFTQDRNTEDEPIRFSVFHEKDFTPIQYEELKKIITDSIDKDKK